MSLPKYLTIQVETQEAFLLSHSIIEMMAEFDNYGETRKYKLLEQKAMNLRDAFAAHVFAACAVELSLLDMQQGESNV